MDEPTTPDSDELDRGHATTVDGETTDAPLDPDNPDRVGIPSVPDPETQDAPPDN